MDQAGRQEKEGRSRSMGDEVGHQGSDKFLDSLHISSSICSLRKEKEGKKNITRKTLRTYNRSHMPRTLTACGSTEPDSTGSRKPGSALV